MLYSPDGHQFVVVTERGLLAQDLIEDSIWMWRTKEVNEFVRHVNAAPPSPIQLVQMATFRKGPIITCVRWLADSSGLLFLGVNQTGKSTLYRVLVSTKTVEALTPSDQDVVDFDVRGGTFAYTVKSPELLTASASIDKRPAFVAGKDLMDLIFPLDRYPERARSESNYCDLWAIVDGKRIPVEHNKQIVHLYQWGRNFDPQGVFRLSPDGQFVAAYRAVDNVPEGWTAYLHQPGVTKSQAGDQDLHASHDLRYVKSYCIINLQTGVVSTLINAPEGTAYGWWGFRPPLWSPNGRALLLPNTFLPLGSSLVDKEILARPCASVYTLVTKKLDCLLLQTPEHQGLESLTGARFDPSDNNRVIFDLGSKGTRTVFHLSKDGSWTRADSDETVAPSQGPQIELEVRQGLNEPPVLVTRALSTKESLLLWDPNPQFKEINLGNVSVFHWKDYTGHDWEAGIITPPDFVQGRRYPLVIQTHGFHKDLFLTYGGLPNVFAARELAAAGIVVLQMPDDLANVVSTAQEAPRHVAGFESAIKILAEQGLIDQERIGLIGFSRTCYYVMQALTAGKLHFAAAEISDGVTYGYWAFMGSVDHGSPNDDESVLGALPFGPGLQTWFAHSPEFNLDKLTSPLLIVEQGSQGIFWQWEEYAGLRYLKRPVELLDLGGDNYEHVLTNPQKRLAAQGSTVDWFRFWLKGEEDSNSAKIEQNARWRGMRNLRQKGTDVQSGKIADHPNR